MNLRINILDYYYYKFILKSYYYEIKIINIMYN